MTELADAIERLENDVDQLGRKIHELELSSSFRDDRDRELARRVDVIQEQVRRLDSEGTAMSAERIRQLDVHGSEMTRERFRRIDDLIQQLRIDVSEVKSGLGGRASTKEVQELRDDAKSIRITIRGALVTFATSIAVQVFIYIALKGKP